MRATHTHLTCFSFHLTKKKQRELSFVTQASHTAYSSRYYWRVEFFFLSLYSWTVFQTPVLYTILREVCIRELDLFYSDSCQIGSVNMRRELGFYTEQKDEVSSSRSHSDINDVWWAIVECVPGECISDECVSDQFVPEHTNSVLLTRRPNDHVTWLTWKLTTVEQWMDFNSILLSGTVTIMTSK